MSAIFWDDNSHVLTLEGLKNLDDQFVNDAAVSVTMYNPYGVEVGGVTWPILMAEDGNSVGTYTCIIPHDCEVDNGDVVELVINAVKTPLVGEWSIKTRVKTRAA
jgi:hypothetical protein